MPRKKRKLEVRMYGACQWMQFDDWYDFADYLKQRELSGYRTTIMGWRYVDA